jgi:hypothetical protein
VAADWRWQVLLCDGCVVKGAVTRDSGDAGWSAWILHAHVDKELLCSDFATVESAQAAVERFLRYSSATLPPSS